MATQELNEQMLLVLQVCKIHNISEQKLIACQTRGCLTGVNVECQKILIIAEQTFRAYTSAHHLNIIENEKLQNQFWRTSNLLVT